MVRARALDFAPGPGGNTGGAVSIAPSRKCQPNVGGKAMFEFLQGLLTLSDVLMAILAIVVAALAWMYWRSRK